MIKFKCNYCTKEYEGIISNRGIIYDYSGEDGQHEKICIEKDEYPCKDCNERAEKVKAMELEAIRREHGNLEPPTPYKINHGAQHTTETS